VFNITQQNIIGRGNWSWEKSWIYHKWM